MHSYASRPCTLNLNPESRTRPSHTHTPGCHPPGVAALTTWSLSRPPSGAKSALLLLMWLLLWLLSTVLLVLLVTSAVLLLVLLVAATAVLVLLVLLVLRTARGRQPL